MAAPSHLSAYLVWLRGESNLDDPALKGQQRKVGGQLVVRRDGVEDEVQRAGGRLHLEAIV